jgi:putative Ca2+/H+ antiporter (TMEM165/GDT1 family)
MIIFSEIGDKTFLIAAILAMRHSRLTVFAGAFSSLLVMSILSAAMGHILPTLIPRKWTTVAAAVLFLVFGAKMLMEGRAMQGGNEKIQEEMKEAEEEIDGDEGVDEHVKAEAGSLEHIEMHEKNTNGTASPASASVAGVGRKEKSGWKEGARNFCSLFFGPVFVQAFVLTFLGEWGDRSQIATIALGAAHVRLPPLFFPFPLGLFQTDAHGDLGTIFIFTERVPRHDWHRRRARLLYRFGRYRWPICIH